MFNAALLTALARAEVFDGNSYNLVFISNNITDCGIGCEFAGNEAIT